MDTPAPHPPPDLIGSPLYLLAVLHAARQSGDLALETITRRRLADIGVRVVFAPPDATGAKGGDRG